MADDIDNLSANESFIGGCPDPTAGRGIVVPGGPATKASFSIRNQSGTAIDLTDYVAADNQDPAPGVVCMFSDAFCPMAPVYTSVCQIVTPLEGKVTIPIPSSVGSAPGIYRAELWVVEDVEDVAATAKYVEKTVVSVESSLLLRSQNIYAPGPLTLGEIRTQLRDFPGLNEYWRQHEFSVDELINSIIQPIYAWNETPPPVASYTAANFPYRQQWLDGATANLMRTAAAWMLRNSRTIKYADGTTETDKDKFSVYMQIAESKWEAYKNFCRVQKYAINFRSPPGIHGI